MNKHDKHKRRALALIGQNRFMDAERELVRLSLKLPRDPVVWLELGRAQLALGHLEEAVGSLRNASDLNPESADVCYLLGMAFGQSGQLTEARRNLDRAVRGNATAWLSPRPGITTWTPTNRIDITLRTRISA